VTGLRDQLLDHAADLLAGPGWGAVTMAELGRRVGVSRQTVYNEVGSKPALAQALVLRELDRLLSAVVAELTGSDDIVDGLEAAALAALRLGRDNVLLKAIVSSAHGGRAELLPLVTTSADPLVQRASSVVSEVVAQQHGDLGLAAGRLHAAIDAVVRLVLSHVMQPAGSPERTAVDIAWVARRVLGR
jgi:AcrR family transcriptional regulator